MPTIETVFSPWQSLGGGALIGVASVLLMLFPGRIIGATGIPATTLTFMLTTGVTVFGVRRVMAASDMRLVTSDLVGLIFGVGILISGMANPAKVLNFFDVAGTWDPSLLLVMGGACVVTFIGYRMVLPRSAPVFEAKFHLPSSAGLDSRLTGGAAVFGIGWGIAGFGPGGALPALGTGQPNRGFCLWRSADRGDFRRNGPDDPQRCACGAPAAP